MELGIIHQASFGLILKDSLSAITLFAGWDATMDHRSRLVNSHAGIQPRKRTNGCNSGPYKVVVDNTLIRLIQDQDIRNIWSMTSGNSSPSMMPIAQCSNSSPTQGIDCICLCMGLSWAPAHCNCTPSAGSPMG